MKQETADLLAGAFINALEETGIVSSGILENLLNTPISAKYKKLFRQTSRATFAQQLCKAPEPSKADLEKALTMIEVLRSAPQQMRPLLRKLAKDLPRARSGPRNRLTAAEELNACVQITSLRSMYSDREAIQQVARKYGVSERTMYRIWRKHRATKKQLNR